MQKYNKITFDFGMKILRYFFNFYAGGIVSPLES